VQCQGEQEILAEVDVQPHHSSSLSFVGEWEFLVLEGVGGGGCVESSRNQLSASSGGLVCSQASAYQKFTEGGTRSLLDIR
jgi:hypothetical protein